MASLAVSRPQLSDEASSYLRALIMSGELRPGDSVRPEEIGELLGISTTPVREALQALRVEGFLDLLPRRGFQVSPLSGQDIRDIFRVQAMIAGELGARAAANATSEDIASLEELHESLIAVSKLNDGELLEDRNHRFHRAVNLLAGSRKIAWSLELVSRYVPRRYYAAIPGWPETTLHDHGRILEGIQAKDPDATRAALEQHIMNAGELLAANFDQRVADAAAEPAEP